LEADQSAQSGPEKYSQMDGQSDVDVGPKTRLLTLDGVDRRTAA
jgi:hypothetical protein